MKSMDDVGRGVATGQNVIAVADTHEAIPQNMLCEIRRQHGMHPLHLSSPSPSPLGIRDM